MATDELTSSSPTPSQASSAPVQRHTVSIIVPFDLGRTFLFTVPEGQSPNHLWQKLFDSTNGVWQARRPLMETIFSYPLGWMVKRRFAPHELIETMQELPWVDAASGFTGYTLLLTIGGGVHVLNATLKADLRGDDWPGVKQTLDDAMLGTALRVLTQKLTGDFFAFLGENLFRALAVVDRFTDLKKLEIHDSYPVFFQGDRFERPDKAFHDQPFDCALVRVGWACAFVHDRQSGPPELPNQLQTEVECDFAVASLTWKALYVMDKQISQIINTSLQNPGHGEDLESLRTRRRHCHDLRLSYMTAVDGSYPIHWTLWERNLHLLECIHVVWKTQKLWELIPEKSDLLAQYHEQLEAQEREAADDRRERSNGRLTRVGSYIAAATLASAIVDVIGLCYQDYAGFWHVALTMSVPVLILGLILALNWRR